MNSASSNSPQGQTRPFEGIVISLNDKGKMSENSDIDSRITTFLNKLRLDFPKSDELKAKLRDLFHEIKRQRNEDPQQRGFPLLPDSLSCKVFNLLTLEEKENVLPAGHAPVTDIVYRPMTVTSESPEDVSEAASHNLDDCDQAIVLDKDWKERSNPESIVVG